MPVDDPLAMAWLDTNDLGNAERLERLARGLLLYVEDIGWAGYDTRRWSVRDGERMAARLAHDVARHIDREAAALDEIAEDEEALEATFGWKVPAAVAQDRVVALRKHAVKSGNAASTEGMLRQARTRLSVQRDMFDTDPLTLNVANGTIRFRKGQGGGWEARFAPHDPADRLMQIARFAYDADAACPLWRERMALVQPMRDTRRMLQMLYGYALTGLTSEQSWFIYQGRGGDGKSATNMVIAKGLGDYHRHADVKTFLEGAKKSGSDHSSDLARLAGDIRLVTCEEPTRNSSWNGMVLKQVTGGTVTCRPMRQEEIEYEPRWKLLVEVNPLPAVPNDDDGFWRRVKLISWRYQFDKGGQAAEPMDLLVGRFLDQEGSGILNWMIAGALKWLETRRLPISAESAEALLAYRASASPIGEWYMECCEVGDDDVLTPSGELYSHFKAWCEAAGMEKVPTQTAFGRWLRDKQHTEKKDRKGSRFRRGIRIRLDGVFGGQAAPPSSSAQPPPSSGDFHGGVGGRSKPPSSSDFEADGWDEDGLPP